MGKWWIIACLLFVLPAPVARSGDEDVKKEKAAAAPQEPEGRPLPQEPDAPDMSLGQEDEPASPEFVAPVETAAPPKRKTKAQPWNPDLNMDYSELLTMVAPAEAMRGVLPPALGTRGYRPNLIAVGAGDRTPGYGGMIEYSWNRMGVGVFYSFKDAKAQDLLSESQSFGGIYGLYRWLPFIFSPYILVGLEFGSGTPETFGGMAGMGLEVQVYSGWTALFGYTYHSTARKAYLGGAFGWAF